MTQLHIWGEQSATIILRDHSQPCTMTTPCQEPFCWCLVLTFQKPFWDFSNFQNKLSSWTLQTIQELNENKLQGATWAHSLRSRAMEIVLCNAVTSDTTITGLCLSFKPLYFRSGSDSVVPSGLKNPHYQEFNQIAAFKNYSLNKTYVSLTHGGILLGSC